MDTSIFLFQLTKYKSLEDRKQSSRKVFDFYCVQWQKPHQWCQVQRVQLFFIVYRKTSNKPPGAYFFKVILGGLLIKGFTAFIFIYLFWPIYKAHQKNQRKPKKIRVKKNLNERKRTLILKQ